MGIRLRQATSGKELRGTVTGQLPYWNNSTQSFDMSGVMIRYVFDIRDFGAVAGGVVDCTAAIAAAFAAAAPVCGEVYADAGVWRVNGNNIVPAGVTFTGPDIGLTVGPREFNIPSILNIGAYFIVAGFDDASTYKGVLFTLSQQCCVQNMGVYYPFQNTNSAPIAYGYTLEVPINAHWTTVQNFYCVNPYNFYHIDRGNGATVTNVAGWPLNIGLNIGRSADVVRVTNVHFNPVANFSTGATLRAWVQANGISCIIDGPEEFAFINFFSFGYADGWKFWDADGDNFKGVYGNATGGGIDLAIRCINVVEPNGLNVRGFTMNGTRLITADATSYAVVFSDTAVPPAFNSCPGVWLVNVSCFNTCDNTVKLNAGSYGQFSWMNGSSRSSINEILNNASTTASASLIKVQSDRSVETRTTGVGTITDDYAGGQSFIIRNKGQRIGANLGDVNTNIVATGGAWYTMPANTMTGNRVDTIQNAGSIDKEIVTIDRQDTSAFTLTINDNGGGPIFVFPAATKLKARFQKQPAGNYTCIDCERMQ